MKYLKLIRRSIKPIIAVATVIVITVFITLRYTGAPATDLSNIISKVSKLMVLPTDETPTLATVTDASKVKDKFLSAKSQTGDRVLIYAKNQLVILYRPSINKIAGVGTVNGDPAFIQAQGATLTILDSTNNSSKVNKVVVAIKAAYPNIKITDGGKSNRQDFPYTIVIDNTGEKSELRAALMKTITAKQGIQPSSEDVATTDFLVIVGKD